MRFNPLLNLVIACALLLAAMVTAVMLASVTARRHEQTVSEWWIPLFVKAALAGALGSVAALWFFNYAQWRVRDAYFEQLVRQSTVISVERRSNRTEYQFDISASGSGLSQLHRYDFELIWEPLAAAGAIGGVLTGVIAHLIARTIIRRRMTQPAFAVLTSTPIDQGIGRSA